LENHLEKQLWINKINDYRLKTIKVFKTEESPKLEIPKKRKKSKESLLIKSKVEISEEVKLNWLKKENKQADFDTTILISTKIFVFQLESEVISHQLS